MLHVNDDDEDIDDDDVDTLLVFHKSLAALKDKCVLKHVRMSCILSIENHPPEPLIDAFALNIFAFGTKNPSKESAKTKTS